MRGLARLLLACALCMGSLASLPAAAHGAKEHGAPVLAAPVESAGVAKDTSDAVAVEGTTPVAAHAPAEEENVMVHPGLPDKWVGAAAISMMLIGTWALAARANVEAVPRGINLAQLPWVGGFVRFLNRSPYPLLAVRIVSVSVFGMVIIAGLFGTALPEHNLATVFVWSLWWPLVVIAVAFVGSAWCAVCPWDTLANWLVRRRFWKRTDPHPGLNRKVPRWLQNVWVALLMFMGLSWLELGAGVTGRPMFTAALALVMLGLSIAFLLLFERKAFCRYACPVGRTLGFYSRLSPIAVRPVNQATCDSCKTMECYHGSKDIEPCPSRLVVGRFSENTYCLSCGNCSLSCPSQNVSWRLRTIDSEAKKSVSPGWDGAWFMLALIGITSFHGVTMLPQWSSWLVAMAKSIGEGGHLFASFALGMMGSFAAPVAVYALAIALVYYLGANQQSSYRKLFGGFAFTALPLAFAYHLAHNLHHLLGEGGEVLRVIANPLGLGAKPLTGMERHMIMMNTLVPQDVTFALQAGLLVVGFWLAVQIARYQVGRLLPSGSATSRLRLLPMIAFFAAITAANLWLMAQDMEMRF